MLCPYCHFDNRYDALTCEYCMHELPMSKERKEEIKKQKQIEKKAKFKNSLIKIIGLSLGVLTIILIIIIAWIKTRG